MSNDEPRRALFHDAVSHWWNSKTKNTEGVSRSQGGTRDGNLRGDTMDGFRDTIQTALVSIGVSPDDIFAGGQLARLASNLPSYFRASKNWDLIVCKNSHFKHVRGGLMAPEGPPTLVAAIEFKSQEGSIGNNQNNRIEESIGNAADFWASYENQNFVNLLPRPWLGYLFVGRYAADDVLKGVEINQPHFPSDPIFDGSDPQSRLKNVRYAGPSYAERYRIFLERMMGKKQYDGAGFIVTNEVLRGLETNYECPFPMLSGEQFLDGLLRHVRAYYF